MRTPKAYIAGAGTTSLLVASAVLLLAVVSTLVAFRDWEFGLGENVDGLVVNGPERLPVDAPLQVTVGAPAAAAAVASVPAPGSVAAGTPAEPSIAPVGAPATGAAISPGGGSGARGVLRDSPQPQPSLATAPVPEQTGALLPETLLSGEVERLVGEVGGTTLGLTEDLGTTLALINPELGGVVTDTGQTLADLLYELGLPPR